VIDTSGSMSSRDLTAALTEVRGVLLAVGGQVELCTCDAAVHGLAPIRSVQQAAGQLRGGGGTDFRSAFEALLGRPRGKRPDVVIFMTDGQGPAPATAPACKTIWVLIGNGSRRPAEWGEAIEVE
jgi:predicted metal-dependent peptidase